MSPLRPFVAFAAGVAVTLLALAAWHGAELRSQEKAGMPDPGQRTFHRPPAASASSVSAPTRTTAS